MEIINRRFAKTNLIVFYPVYPAHPVIFVFQRELLKISFIVADNSTHLLSLESYSNDERMHYATYPMFLDFFIHLFGDECSLCR